MSKFDEKIGELKKESSSTAFSKKTQDDVAYALINDPDYERREYRRKGDEFEVVKSYPVKDFRNGLKDLVKSEFGVDTAEADKLDTMDLSKKVASPVGDMAGIIVKGVMKTGKTFRFSPESDSETVMGISLHEMPEKDIETRKPEKQADGRVIQVPTGDKVHYTKRTEITASNKHLPTTKYKLK